MLSRTISSKLISYHDWTNNDHAILQAVCSQDLGVLRRCLQKAPEGVFICNSQGETALHVCLRVEVSRVVERVRMLVDAGADVNQQSRDGWTPIHMASRKGRLDVLEVMLAVDRADLSLKTNQGVTAFCHLVQILPESAVYEGESGDEADDALRPVLTRTESRRGLMKGVEDERDIGKVEEEDEDDRDAVNAPSSEEIHSRSGRTFTQLLPDGPLDKASQDDDVFVSKSQWTVAAKGGQPALHSSDPASDSGDSSGRLSGWRVDTSKRRIYVEILRRMAIEDSFKCKTLMGDTPMHFAAMIGNAVAIREILDVCSDPDPVNFRNETPLMLALVGLHIPTAQVLLKAGADPMKRTRDGTFPYGFATILPRMSGIVSLMEACMESRPDWAAVPNKDKCSHVAQKAADLVDHITRFQELKLPKKKKGDLQFTQAMKVIILGLLRAMGLDLDRPPSNSQWASVFYMYTNLGRKVLGPAVIDHFIELITAFLTHTQAGTSLHAIAKSLLHFCSKRRHDATSCLIGLQVSPKLLSDVRSPLNSLCDAVFRLADDLRLCLHVTNAPTRTHVEPLSSYPEFTPEQLKRITGHWCNVCTKEELVRKKNLLAVLVDAEVGMVDRWRCSEVNEGDVVIGPSMTGRKSAFRFYRYSGFVVGNAIEVYSSPDETCKCLIDRRLVLPLPHCVVDSMGSVNELGRHVVGTVHHATTRILRATRKNLWMLLRTRGVDVELLNRCSAMHQLPLADLPAIENSLKYLYEIGRDAQMGPFFDGLRRIVDKHYTMMTSDFDSWNEIFAPLKSKLLDSVLHLPTEVYTAKRIDQYTKLLREAAMFLKKEQERVKDGTSKNEMASWWLRLIEDRCNTHLRERGFKFDAIPENYIDQAPDDLGEIKENLRIVRIVLSENDPATVQLIGGLKAEIFPKIEAFLHNAKFIVSDHLGIEVSTFTVHYASQLLKDIREEVELAEFMRIENLIKDVQYLEAIADLERPEVQREKRYNRALRDLNLVPISGLIMGVFARNENELKTILEVWDHRTKPASSPGIQRSNSEIMPRSSSDARTRGFSEGDVTGERPALRQVWSQATLKRGRVDALKDKGDAVKRRSRKDAIFRIQSSDSMRRQATTGNEMVCEPQLNVVAEMRSEEEQDAVQGTEERKTPFSLGMQRVSPQHTVISDNDEEEAACDDSDGIDCTVGSEREHNVVKGTNALQEDMDTMEGADERGCGDADAENSE